MALAAPLAPTAQAGELGFFVCRAGLNLAAGSGHTACVGTMIGVWFGSGLRTSSLLMDLDYVETGCPLVGEATGTMSMDGTYFADVTLTRVGTQVTMILSGGHLGGAEAKWQVDAVDLGPGLCSDTDVSVTLQGFLGGVA